MPALGDVLFSHACVPWILRGTVIAGQARAGGICCVNEMSEAPPGAGVALKLHFGVSAYDGPELLQRFGGKLCTREKQSS